MRYAMLLCGEESTWHDLSPADEETAMNEVYAWFERWQPTGKVLTGGAELDKSDKAKTVRRDAAGKTVVTDGPYLELKEVIGGLVLIEVDSVDEAVEIASSWPLRGNDSIELRPIMERG